MAFSYNKKNLANTTITGAISSSDTSITVDDATVFPSGYFYATLMPSSEMSTFSNSEIVLVTNISSNTLTIARGQKNTTARAFSAGAIITNGVYTEDLDFAQSVGKKIFSATWGGQSSPYYKITDDMLKVVPDEGTSIRAIFDTDYASGTAKLSINESTSGVATVSGSNISITDAENLAPVDVKVKGDTTQQTYSGINTAFLNQSLNTDRYNYTYTSQTDADISATKNGVGGLFFAAFEAQVVSGHTYRIKATVGASSSAIQIYLYKDRTWGTSAGGRAYLGVGNVDVQITPDYTGKMVLGVYFDGPADRTVYCKDFMFGENVQSTSPYEPYTGGNPSPSPDYPQTIQVVGGEQTVTISDGNSNTQTFDIQLSKNLYYSTLQRGYLDEDTGALRTNTTSRMVTDFVPIRPNSTYTLSAKSGVPGRTVQASIYYYTENSFISYENWSSVAKTFTTPANTTRIRIVFRLDNSADCTAVSFYDIQVEKGSSATAYSGFVELAKMGNRQDYIYKSGSDWYIHKEVGKRTLEGSEVEWATGPYGTNSYQFVLNGIGGDNQTVCIIANLFCGVTYDNRTVAQDNIVYRSFTDDQSLRTMIYVRNTNQTSLANFKAWLGTNTLSTRYILATPTNTKITDTTLISQLNALANATLYAGTNNIVVTGGLDGILEVQYYKANSGVNLVPIVNGAYVADDNTRNVAPVKAGIPYDLTYHNGNWYVMNMVKKITADNVDFTTYSTTEQVVGTWTDGKTIYRRVITAEFGTYLPSGVTSIPHNISDISEIIGIDTMYQLGWDPTTYGDEAYLAINGFQVIAGSQNISIINVGENSWSGKFKFILSYTKNTAQQTRSVIDNEESGEEPEEPIEEQQDR
jgi:hypothetical protein